MFTSHNFIMASLLIGQAIIFLTFGFFLLSFFFFARLISAVADWMSAILRNMV